MLCLSVCEIQLESRQMWGQVELQEEGCEGLGWLVSYYMRGEELERIAARSVGQCWGNPDEGCWCGSPDKGWGY